MSSLIFRVLLLVLPFAFDALESAMLDCSTFGANASNLSAFTSQSWSARLHACFEANPYDTSQLPAPDTALPIVLYYDFALVNLMSFQEGSLKVYL